MRIGVSGACVLALLVVCACSGASSMLGGGGDGGGGDGDSSDDAAGSGDDGSSSSDDGSGSDASGSGGSSGSGGASGGFEAASAAAPCPDIGGAYAQFSWDGMGCGDVNGVAPECIVLAQQLCAFQLVSAPSSGEPAINGVVSLQSDGSFSGAALRFGTVQRTGCAGQWDAASESLRLHCPRMGSNKPCMVTITRTGYSC